MESYHVASIAAVIGDPTRTIMLTTLLDGRAHTAGELSSAAGVSASTGSVHLARMMDAALVSRLRHGRHVYYQITDHRVAEAIESLARLVPRRYERRHVPPCARGLVDARTCYDHLAGRLGVALADAMLEKQFLGQQDLSFVLTPAGEAFAAGLGIDLGALRRTSRPLVKACLDWTERRYHVAGSFGVAVFHAFLEKRWLTRGDEGRAVVLTRIGRRNLEEHLGLSKFYA